MSDLTIVTAASSNHFRCLKNLLYSLSLHERKTPVIVYDLGLQEAECAELRHLGWLRRRFAFENYPAHVDIRVARGQYAWKPIIIAEVFRSVGGMVLWLDAGNLVHRRLRKIRRALSTQGLYSPLSSGNIARWTHPGTLQSLKVSPRLLAKRNRNGALVGFAAGHPGIRQLVVTWEQCALDANCIAPPGSSRKNHRQDQAVLSVLMYQFQQKYGYVFTDEKLDVSIQNDNVPPEKLPDLLGVTLKGKIQNALRWLRLRTAQKSRRARQPTKVFEDQLAQPATGERRSV
jgi:hypothetical protein